MSDKNPIFLIQEVALSNVFDKNLPYDYYQRRICREYSKIFHTPLPDVMELPFHEVLLHFFENRYEEILAGEDGEEELKQIALRTIDPDFDQKEEDELKAFADKIIKNEKIKTEVKKTYNESPPIDSATKDDDGLDLLVDGIGKD